MIYSFTSKRSGNGRSTMALMTSLYLCKSTKNSICLVDLSINSDINKFLGLKKNKCVDDLISEIYINPNVDPSEYCLEFNELSVLAGTNVVLGEYLVRRASIIKDIIRTLDSKFDVVILDIDYAIYEELESLDFKCSNFYVMSQNTVEVYDYKEEMRDTECGDVFVVNQLQDGVYPEFKLFNESFKNSLHVPFDPDLKTRMNKNKISLTTINESICFTGIKQISDIVNGNQSGVIKKSSGKTKKQNKKKKSLFSKLFGR